MSGVFSLSNDLEGTQVGLAAGYNVQHGSWVFGGELAYGNGELTYVDLFQGNYLGDIFDVKARVGYASGSILVYGILGYSQTVRTATNAGSYDVGGLSYGAGADVMVSDRVFVGLEFLTRDFGDDEGDVPGFPTSSSTHSPVSATLRLGVKF